MNVAIITGASSGIGKEFFLSLKERKEQYDEIWVIARNREKLEELRALTETPLRIFSLDLSKDEAYATFEQALKEEQPSIRLLICASGFGRFESIENDDLATLTNMVDLNCNGVIGITKPAIPYLSEGSLVIVIASIAAMQPIPYIATYAASKAFVLSYARALNRELKSHKSRCLAVCPFWTKTAFFDRAKSENPIVKKYVVMYDPKDIVKRTWHDAKNKRKDVSICGAYTRGQRLLVKLLPHRIVMNVWMNQQKLK